MQLTSNCNYTLSKRYCSRAFSPTQQQLLSDSWTEFIGRFEPFELYSTFTFREEVHPEQADRCFNRFVRHINEELFGRRYREKGKGVYYVRALEMQRRGVLHFHALFGGGVKKLRRLSLMDRWFEDNGIARIEPYDITKGAKGYLSKYVFKGGEIDLHIPPYLKERFGLGDKLQLNLLSC